MLFCLVLSLSYFFGNYKREHAIYSAWKDRRTLVKSSGYHTFGRHLVKVIMSCLVVLILVKRHRNIGPRLSLSWCRLITPLLQQLSPLSASYFPRTVSSFLLIWCSFLPAHLFTNLYHHLEHHSTEQLLLLLSRKNEDMAIHVYFAFPDISQFWVNR